MKGIMIVGTGSDVGKSLIATAICRALSNEGVRVAPFKSQNMSNNSYVTVDGKEIGRAQGIQAEAARTEATVWMNPILLKPRSDSQSEVVFLGKAIQTLSGRGYRHSFYKKGIDVIGKALARLTEEYDVIVMEGAGSPVEINLKDRELVNMKVAEMADVPVILVADIDRGGVFASIVGTLSLLEETERSRVRGLIINKFRGDLSLFEDGINWLEENTGIPVLGVLPYMEGHGIDGEDSLSIPPAKENSNGDHIEIVIIKPPYISNYTDFEPFYQESDVSIRWVSKLEEMGEPDAVILPGTKSTLNDLIFLNDSGISDWLKKFHERSGFITGICGGYQMLGTLLKDPDGTDTGTPGAILEGLGIIPCQTTFSKEKKTVRATGYLHNAAGFGNIAMDGYEIHLGETVYSEGDSSPFLILSGKEEGYCCDGGRVIGTYLHHLFHNDQWRTAWLNILRVNKGLQEKQMEPWNEQKEQRYNDLAAGMKEHLDWERLKGIIEHWSYRCEDA
ncbi:cobyric acid synthase [Bacillus massilinigeriensis]|uniref:cobyric acid synthase n=1 Tax=Bacillus mediterraneensis TaxID=1805474 RepID=UPI0008F90C39|nr:cobyric acid synthase [Bacillus mediterraneensis]